MRLLILASIALATSACPSDGVRCTDDSQCGAGQVCDTKLGACIGGAGEGEGEGDIACEGEGEGEGGASECATQQAVFGLPDGDGSIPNMTCTLENDGNNVAGCADASTAFAIVCDLGGYVVTGDCAAGLCQGNEVELSDDDPNAPLQPHTCTTAPSLSNGSITCPVCYDAAPAEIAAQFTDKPGFSESAAVCVDVSGTT